MADRSPDFEDKRLAALYAYDVLDTEPEESFDRITRLVRLTMGTPIATVSLVDRDRQWFKSRQGTDTVETPRDISFCTHTVQKDEPLVVTNALDDPRFRQRHTPLYRRAAQDAERVGALCAIDTKPGSVSAEQINVMQDLARLVVDELELRKLAAIDSLTGAMTGRAFALESKKSSSRRAAIIARSAASCSTSITSRRSTTLSGMPPAIRCCAV
jgi:GAF domain-containing protein